MTKIICSIAVIGLVFGSFLTFPAYLHWMLSIWAGVAIVQTCNHRPGWPWLLGMIVILTIKRPGYSAEFWILVSSVLVVSFFDWRTRWREEKLDGRQSLIMILILGIAIVVYGAARWFDSNASETLVLNERPIACLGDSLTDHGYPQELEKLIRVPVADFGLDGITTDDGIKLIPKILAVNPQLVVIELGGHDYNSDKKMPHETKMNLALIIESFLKRNIGVILVEIPRGFISDPYGGIERELSAQYDLQLIDDSLIRSFIFNSPVLPPGMWLDPSRRYSEDGLHPNKLGNRFFAKKVSQALSRVLGKEILQEVQ